MHVSLFASCSLCISAVNWISRPLESQAEPSLSELWTIENRDKNMSGLIMASVHFVRPAVVSMWETLSSLPAERCCLRISGPRGTGKSSTLFAWAVHMGGTMGKKVLWVHELEGQYHILRIVDSKAEVAICALSDLTMLRKCFTEFDVICLDGLRKEMVHLRFLAVDVAAKVVTCTSYQSATLSSEAAVCLNADDLTVDSWTRSEYELCMAKGLPGKAFADADSLDLYHYFAGGSMRLMLWEIPKLQRFLRNKVDEVSDKKALLHGRQGFAGQLAVNTLIAEFGGEAVLLSQYVTRLVAWCTDDTFIAEAERHLPNNPSWQGWVFEMKVIHMVRRDNTLSLKLSDGNSLVLEGSAAPESFMELPARVPTSNMWLLPEKWNQACFDLVFFTESTLWFVQVTVAKTHQYKLKALAPIIPKLRHQVASTRFVVVKNNPEFHVTPGNFVTSGLGHGDAILCCLMRRENCLHC
jgi:hypothetical protein